jgi:KDO2-lipid IV(A) lauroyltransferase
MFLVRWISGWPLGLLHAVGGVLGWLVWLCSPTYRRRLRANAELAGVPARARRLSIAETGRMVAETPWLWLHADNDTLARKVTWRNPQALDAAVAARRPLVILTPHMGSFEVAARAYTLRYGHVQPLTVLYRPARQRVLREFQEQARQRPTMPTAPANLAGVRQMLRALKRGESVGRLPRGAGYAIHTSQLVRALPKGTDAAALVEATTIINETMEQVILSDPGQYMWGYNRYKAPRAAETTEPGATAPAPRAEGNE